MNKQLRAEKHLASKVINCPPRTQELKVLATAKLLSNHVIRVKKLSQGSTIKAVLLSAIKKKCVLVPQKGQPVQCSTL